MFPNWASFSIGALCTSYSNMLRGLFGQILEFFGLSKDIIPWGVFCDFINFGGFINA